MPQMELGVTSTHRPAGGRRSTINAGRCATLEMRYGLIRTTSPCRVASASKCAGRTSGPRALVVLHGRQMLRLCTAPLPKRPRLASADTFIHASIQDRGAGGHEGRSTHPCCAVGDGRWDQRRAGSAVGLGRASHLRRGLSNRSVRPLLPLLQVGSPGQVGPCPKADGQRCPYGP